MEGLERSESIDGGGSLRPVTGGHVPEAPGLLVVEDRRRDVGARSRVVPDHARAIREKVHRVWISVEGVDGRGGGSSGGVAGGPPNVVHVGRGSRPEVRRHVVLRQLVPELGGVPRGIRLSLLLLLLLQVVAHVAGEFPVDGGLVDVAEYLRSLAIQAVEVRVELALLLDDLVEFCLLPLEQSLADVDVVQASSRRTDGRNPGREPRRRVPHVLARGCRATEIDRHRQTDSKRER
mmetsp:Transcript_23966/g.50962  ORF Transcript_23966/g.50962 Transcript_23966/m.50962 type:complete len:235 (+) Transcript_23966:1590-2294(+)